MRICVLGTGYVGLVTGVGLAEMGNDVACVDVDLRKVARLSKGEPTIYEPGLEELLRRNLRDGRLAFHGSGRDPISRADVIFLAVGTPPAPRGADLTQVFSAVEDVKAHARPGALLVIKSTVPVGTAKEVQRRLDRADVWVASNPEFLKEGTAVQDFMKPDRVVVGVAGSHQDTGSAHPALVLKDLYEPFVRTGARVMVMSCQSAEMTKLASNALLATRLSFMNEVANLCGKVGADVDQVRRGMGADPRIGHTFLFAGPGFGGSCFPKDLLALAHLAEENGEPALVAQAAYAANARQKKLVGAKILSHLGGSLEGRLVAVWGLTFKANTDDVRESPAMALVETLLRCGARVSAYDPAADISGWRPPEGTHLVRWDNPYACVEGADALAIMTDWPAFRVPPLGRIRELMRPSPAVFDARNLWDPKAARAAGFAYHGTGRP